MDALCAENKRLLRELEAAKADIHEMLLGVRGNCCFCKSFASGCDKVCGGERAEWRGPCAEKVLSAAADMLEQDGHFAGTGKMLPFTLDELDCLNVGVLGGVPIWIEHRSDKPDLLRWEFSGWQVLQGMERDYMFLNNGVELNLRNLNKAWRSWKRQPTQEETANAPWEEITR